MQIWCSSCAGLSGSRIKRMLLGTKARPRTRANNTILNYSYLVTLQKFYRFAKVSYHVPPPRCFHLSLFSSICPVRVTFPKPSILVWFLIDFTCLFLIMIVIVLSMPFLSFHVYYSLSILLQNQIQAAFNFPLIRAENTPHSFRYNPVGYRISVQHYFLCFNVIFGFPSPSFKLECVIRQIESRCGISEPVLKHLTLHLPCFSISQALIKNSREKPATFHQKQSTTQRRIVKNIKEWKDKKKTETAIMNI